MKNKTKEIGEEIIIKESKPVSLMVSKVKSLVIVSTDEDVVKATEFLVNVKNKLDSLEEERKGYTQPINESLKKINARFKELTEPLKEAERTVKDAILSYREKKEEERLKVQEKMQKQTKDPNLEIMPSLPDIVESKSGESRTSKKWVFEVEDEKKVPREYLVVDAVKVNEAIKNGERNIAGLKIFQKETLSIYR